MKTKKLEVGQQWKRRDGKQTTINHIDSDEIAGSSVLRVRGEDGHWRTLSGHISEAMEHPFDLIELVEEEDRYGTESREPEDEDPAKPADEAVRDGVKENGEPPEIENGHRTGDVQAERPADTWHELMLFDALVLAAVRNGLMPLVDVETVLSGIRKIIEARRAL